MNFIQSLKESIGGYYRNLVSSYVRRMASRLTVLEERVSALYAHLEARGVPMPTDESGNPLPKDTEHLLPTLRHLDTRKVETYCADGSDGIADGMPIGKLLLTPYKGTMLIDRSNGWQINDNRQILFTDVEDFEIGCTSIKAVNNNAYTINMPKCKRIYMPNLVNVESISNCTMIGGAMLEEIILPSFTGYGPSTWGGWSTVFGGSPNLRKLVLGTIIHSTRQTSADTSVLTDAMPSLIHLEIGEGTAVSLWFDRWSPTIDSSNLAEFQSNFHEYIAKRLATFPESGSHPTLTLSQTVRDAITQQSEDLIVATKHWSLAPARTQV